MFLMSQECIQKLRARIHVVRVVAVVEHGHARHEQFGHVLQPARLRRSHLIECQPLVAGVDRQPVALGQLGQIPEHGAEVQGRDIGGQRPAQLADHALGEGGFLVDIRRVDHRAQAEREGARRGVQCAMTSSVCSGDSLYSLLHLTISIKLPPMDCPPRVLVLLLVID